MIARPPPFAHIPQSPREDLEAALEGWRRKRDFASHQMKKIEKRLEDTK